MSLQRTPTFLEKIWSQAGPFLKALADPSHQRTLCASSSTSLQRRDTKSSSSPGKDQKNDLLVVVVESTIKIAFLTIGYYIIAVLARKFLFDYSLPTDPDEPPVRSTSSVNARLTRILRKRLEIQHAEKGGGDAPPPPTTTRIVIPELTPMEKQIAEEIIDADEIETSFADIGGLDDTKQEIYELTVLPLLEPELFTTGRLVQPTKGILLYGPPGTGKTMLAKALAKEAHAVFIPLHLSKILNKWVGVSNKLIAAAFSLAKKLQPAIIFVDELDTFLKANHSETAYMDTIKAEFLTLWDGITTSRSARVMVLGATNKPHTIDSAILRRMPRHFEVPLPNAAGRLDILKLILKDESVDQDVFEFLPALASDRMTSGYSGSDLEQLCLAAAMVRVQERAAGVSRQKVMGEKTRIKISKAPLRPISREDLIMALDKVKQTGAAAWEYGRQQLRKLALEDLRAAGNATPESEDDDNTSDVPNI